MKKFKVTYYFKNEYIKEELEHVDLAALNHQLMQKLKSAEFLTFIRDKAERIINIRTSEIYSFSVKEIEEIE